MVSVTEAIWKDERQVIESIVEDNPTLKTYSNMAGRVRSSHA